MHRISRFRIGMFLTLIAVLGAHSPSFAQDMPNFGGLTGRMVFNLEHQAEAAPSSGPGFNIERQKAFVAIPVRDRLFGAPVSLIFRGERTRLGHKLHFADRGVETPAEFGTAEFGLSWQKKDSEGNRHGLVVTYGSAGRRLLDNGLDPIVTGTLTVEKKASTNRSWIYFLNYSNNRVLWNHIPIPGFAYKISEKSYTLVMGVPFLFGMWHSDPLIFSAALTPAFASSELSYRFWGPLMFFTNVKWQPKSYQNLIQNRGDRLIFDNKEAGAGLRAYFGRQASLSASYVWNFDRRFFLGRTMSEPVSEPVDIGDSGGIQISGKLTF